MRFDGFGLIVRRVFGMTRVVSSCMMVLAAGQMAGAAIPNGGFELNTVNTGGGGFFFGDVADGWTKFDGIYFNPTPDMFDNNGIDGELPGSFTALIGTSAYEGTKFAGIGGWSTDPNLPGFSEGIVSTPVLLTANHTYLLQLAMMHDSTNNVGYNSPTPLTVRLRQGGSGAGTVFGSMAANTLPKTWQLRTLSFQVGSTGLYEIVLSNESSIGSYLGIDDVRFVPEPSSMVAVICVAGFAFARRRR